MTGSLRLTIAASIRIALRVQTRSKSFESAVKSREVGGDVDDRVDRVAVETFDDDVRRRR
jgi:hypothetical protein